MKLDDVMLWLTITVGGSIALVSIALIWAALLGSLIELGLKLLGGN